MTPEPWDWFLKDLFRNANFIEEQESDYDNLIWRWGLGIGSSEMMLKRQIPVRVYFDDPIPNEATVSNIICKLDDILNLIGFYRSSVQPDIIGSLLKRFFYKSKDYFTSEEVFEKLSALEKALENRYLNIPDAEATKAQAEAIAILIESLDEAPYASIQAGSLLLLKYTSSEGQPVIISRNLSIEQMKRIEENQAILKSPNELLEWLSIDEDIDWPSGMVKRLT